MFSKYLEKTKTRYNSIIGKWLPHKVMTFIMNSIFKTKRTKKKDEDGYWINVYEFIGTNTLEEVIADNNLILKDYQKHDSDFEVREKWLSQNVV